MLFELLDVFASPEAYRVTVRDGELHIEPIEPDPASPEAVDGHGTMAAADSPAPLAFARMSDGFGARAAL